MGYEIRIDDDDDDLHTYPPPTTGWDATCFLFRFNVPGQEPTEQQEAALDALVTVLYS